MSDATQPKPARAVRTPGAATQPKPARDGEDMPAEAGTVAPLPQTTAAGPAPVLNEIDVDPKTIRAPVLTRQGWVCPDESGRPKPGDAARL